MPAAPGVPARDGGSGLPGVKARLPDVSGRLSDGGPASNSS